jgi:hypothetical protein
LTKLQNLASMDLIGLDQFRLPKPTLRFKTDSVFSVVTIYTEM